MKVPFIGGCANRKSFAFYQRLVLVVGPAKERKNMSTKAKISETKNQRRGNKIVSREAWVAARKKLLKAEKELTRRSDELAKRRQALPWVQVDKAYQNGRA